MDEPERLIDKWPTFGRFMRLLNVVMALYFLLCAALQHNDPDPELWMPLSVIAAVLTLTAPYALGSPGKPRVVWIVACALELAYCLGLGCYVLANLTEETYNGAYNSTHISDALVYEEGRELAGLIITVVWFFAIVVSAPHRIRKSDSRLVTSLLFVLVAALALTPLCMYTVCQVGSLTDRFAYCQHMCAGSG